MGLLDLLENIGLASKIMFIGTWAFKVKTTIILFISLFILPYFLCAIITNMFWSAFLVPTWFSPSHLLVFKVDIMILIIMRSYDLYVGIYTPFASIDVTILNSVTNYAIFDDGHIENGWTFSQGCIWMISRPIRPISYPKNVF